MREENRMKNPSPGTIRHATAGDLPRLHEIVVAAWRPIFERYRLIVGEEMWNDLWGDWERGWVLYTPETWPGRGIVTELEGEVAGFATWWLPSETLAEVGGNAVAPQFQGRGIGSAQIRWVVEMFRENGYRCAKVHTGMDPAHGPARAEYRQAGLCKGVTNSVYLNYLEEVARIPVREGLSCRGAEPEDVELVRHLACSAWIPVYESVRGTLGQDLFALAFPNAAERKANEWAQVAADAPDKVRLALEKGRPAGFAVLEADPNKKIGEIKTVAVAPEGGSRGIGCALCVDAFDVFRQKGLRYVRLTAGLGEVNERTRQMCWNAGLYRELPSIDYYMLL
jgi:ribosomal protein S18 acetylase RimI-like enzyme